MKQNDLDDRTEAAKNAVGGWVADRNVIDTLTDRESLRQLTMMLENLVQNIIAEKSMDRTEMIEELHLVSVAKRAYSRRRTRELILGDASLADGPAWDMLLDLYVCSKERRSIAITSACIGASCPQTTALRWLNALENLGLVRRFADNADLRRKFVELTPLGSAKVAQALRLYRD